MIAALNKFANEALGEQATQVRLRDLGFQADGKAAPAQTAKMVADEASRWAPIIKATVPQIE